MYNRAAKPKRDNTESGPDPLVRGQFSDGRRDFTVRASSSTAPDSFQVHPKGNQSDPILVVSGLNTGNLHATWSEEWRSASPEWREWARNNAFKAFHTVSSAEPRPQPQPQPQPQPHHTAPGKVRFCRG